jgi:hypothetical protein
MGTQQALALPSPPPSDTVRCRSHLTTAIVMYREMGMNFYLEKEKRSDHFERRLWCHRACHACPFHQ